MEHRYPKMLTLSLRAANVAVDGVTLDCVSCVTLWSDLYTCKSRCIHFHNRRCAYSQRVPV